MVEPTRAPLNVTRISLVTITLGGVRRSTAGTVPTGSSSCAGWASGACSGCSGSSGRTCGSACAGKSHSPASGPCSLPSSSMGTAGISQGPTNPAGLSGIWLVSRYSRWLSAPRMLHSLRPMPRNMQTSGLEQYEAHSPSVSRGLRHVILRERSLASHHPSRSVALARCALLVAAKTFRAPRNASKYDCISGGMLVSSGRPFCSSAILGAFCRSDGSCASAALARLRDVSPRRFIRRDAGELTLGVFSLPLCDDFSVFLCRFLRTST